MTAAPVVVCAGRLYADLIFTGLPEFPALGTETFAQALGVHPGGGAVITAAHLAAGGVRPLLLSILPASPFAEAILPTIRDFGIDVSLCKPAAKTADPQLTVAIARDGDRAFLTRRDGPAAPFPMLKALKATKATHLHIAELATLVERPGLLKRARRAGMTVSLDCSWNQAQFGSDIADLIAAVDIFFPNRMELEALLSAGLTLPLAPVTVVKDGASGAEVFTPGGRWKAAAKSVKDADTTGAGDAFDAGYLAAWLQGKTPKACLLAGHKAGAVAVKKPGGFGALKRRGR